MKIQLKNWKVTNLNFTILDKDIERKKNLFNLEVNNLFSKNELSDVFIVVFKIDIHDKHFNMNLEATFNFKVDENISEEFKLSSFPKINAPAIAFPYLRAFISNFTLQSGVKPVILPSINFVEFGKENKKTEQL